MGYIENYEKMVSMADAKALTYFLLNAYKTTNTKETYRVVELGTYMGFTASIMSTALKDYSNVVIDTIDNNKGTLDNTCQGVYEYAKIYLEKTDCKNVNQIVGDSIDIAKSYANDSIDFLFIDADHSYNYLKREIPTWYLKVKNKGFICGHDYDKKFNSATPKMLDYLKALMTIEGDKDTHSIPLDYIDSVNKDYTLDEYDNGKYAPYPRICVHGGVILAVNELFGTEPSTFSPYLDGKYTSIWCIQIVK
jgi:hypothetical protein